MRGRKRKQDSRADQLRRALVAWKQMPESVRPSLRQLARQLATSHQLLEHYLDGLETWWHDERYRILNEEIKGIRARAEAENRLLTPWEEQRIRDLERTAIRSFVMSSWLRQVAKFTKQAKQGPLHRLEFKMLELFAKHGVPGAKELLEKREQIGIKKKKAFERIVQEMPRLENEPSRVWVRRVRAECTKFESMPTVITVKLLEKYSRRADKKPQENLPLNAQQIAKSFKSVGGDAGNSAKVEGRRSDAVV